MKKLLLILALASLTIIACDQKKEKGKEKIYLITMDQMDQHWVKVDEGAQKAAEEAGDVEYVWLAPDVKDDNKQIEAINNAVAGGASVIVLAPNGPDAVTSSLKEATEAGVKIVYVDGGANYPGEQLIATDNKAGGKSVGKVLLEELTRKGITNGKLGVISVNAATESTVLREEGFRSAFDGTDFVILETQYSQGDPVLSKDIAANFISDGVVGIFGANEGSTVGVGNAVKEAGGNVIGVGCDASDMNLSLVANGSLFAIMAQNPYEMGYQSVQSAAKILKGEKLTPEYIDTGVKIITMEDAK